MKIFNLSIYNGKFSEFLELLKTNSQKTLVFTPNPEILYRAYYDEEFMQILQHATHNVPDGNGLYVAEMMQEWNNFLSACLKVFFQKKSTYETYGELIKGSDITRKTLETKTENPYKILIIDRKNLTPKNDFEKRKSIIQQNLKSILSEKYPHHQFFIAFDTEKSPDEIAEIIQTENIHFVFSCLGMKVQEKMLIKIFEKIPDNFPVVGLGVGASIDFLLWLQKRAPKIFIDFGLEWLYRLITQPKIRYQRIKTALVDFPKLVKHHVKNSENITEKSEEKISEKK